jgi:hypothetical protein
MTQPVPFTQTHQLDGITKQAKLFITFISSNIDFEIKCLAKNKTNGVYFVLS